jgi:hypothetical protein
MTIRVERPRRLLGVDPQSIPGIKIVGDMERRPGSGRQSQGSVPRPNAVNIQKTLAQKPAKNPHFLPFLAKFRVQKEPNLDKTPIIFSILAPNFYV